MSTLAATRLFLVIFIAFICSFAKSLAWGSRSLVPSRDHVQMAASLQRSEEATTRRHRHVCVLLPRGHENEQHSMTQAANDVASRLSIPLVSFESLLDNADAGDLAFDHAIDLQPCGDNDFALSIQPILPSDIPKLYKRRSRETAFAMKPIFIDFCPDMLSGRQSLRSGKDLLLQAVAPRKGTDPTLAATIYDLTAGFGQDSLILASAGARAVTMVERDPIIHMLLADALRRLVAVSTHSPDKARRRAASELSNKLSLVYGEGANVAQTMVASANNPNDLPDVVYIDSMFPPRTKRASVKKNMQVLHSLLQSQENREEGVLDESVLLDAALSLARSRVVCKRPLGAPSVGSPSDRQPSYKVEGSTNRWDVYLQLT